MELRKFDSGAVRDADADSTRYDLVAPEGLRRLAETYAEGAKKYSDHNWRKGMPFSATANHAIKHIFQYLAGMTNEDHLAHAAWGLFALMEQEQTHPELDDRFFKPKAQGWPQLTEDIAMQAGVMSRSISHSDTASNNKKAFGHPVDVAGTETRLMPGWLPGFICIDTTCTHPEHYEQEAAL